MKNGDFSTLASQANQELEKVYAEPLEKWRPLAALESEAGRCLSIPCFIKVQPEYFQAKPRVIFVGQETHGWWTDYPEPKGKIAVSQITNFYQGEWSKLFLEYRSPYWQTLRYVAHALKIADPLHSFLFTNVFPCDVNKRQAPLALHNDFRSWKILPQELKILKPECVIFFCGHEYYGNLKEYFGAYPEENISKQNPAVFYQPEGVSWRGIVTYHPAYLRRSGMWPRVRESIIRFVETPPHRDPVTLKELEARADEVESGNVKPVSSDEFDAHIARLRASITAAAGGPGHK